MLRIKATHVAIAIGLALIVVLLIRMHAASGEGTARSRTPDLMQGRVYAEAWCAECHSVGHSTAGVGKFAPDFSVVAQRRTAHWLNVFLRTEHKIMPDFVLKPQESDDLVAYILSLKRN